MLGLSLTKEKKRLSDILFGSLFRLSCKLCTALSRYARMPTEKMQRFCRQREYGKNSDVENSFRWPAALNLSTACHNGVGLGGIKGEKERFVFERFFVGTEHRKPLFPVCIYIRQKTAKRDKKIVCFTKNPQNTCLNRPQKTGGRLTASARFKRKDIQQYINNTSSTPKILD